MAKIHVLQKAGNNLYNIVVHAALASSLTNSVPAATGGPVTIQTALVNAGLAATVMPIGNGPGQISNAEANQITAGQVLEAQTVWQDDPSWTGPQRLQDLQDRATQAVNNTLADYTERLKYFGATIAST